MAPYFDRILLLHIQALASLEGIATQGDRGLLDYVLARERRFWAQLAADRGLDNFMVPAIAKAMAVITLKGGVRTEKDAVTALKLLPLLSDEKQAVLTAIAAILHATYPGTRYIEPVLPDLLGEHLIQAEWDETIEDIVFGGGT